MGIIYTHYDVLDVDATYKVSYRSSGSGEYFVTFITYMDMAAILVMCQTSWKMVHCFLRKANFNFHV